MTVIPPLPIDPNSTVADQARAIFAIIEERLATIGSDKAKIGHIFNWIRHLLHFKDVTKVWNDWVKWAEVDRAGVANGMAEKMKAPVRGNRGRKRLTPRSATGPAHRKSPHPHRPG